MGLDMEIRLIKKNNRNITKTIMEGSGRIEFSWLREWIGDDRYGKFVELDEAMAQELIQLAIDSIKADEEDGDPDLFELDSDAAIEDRISIYIIEQISGEYTRGTPKAIALLSLWNVLDAAGWIMTIECDW